MTPVDAWYVPADFGIDHERLPIDTASGPWPIRHVRWNAPGLADVVAHLREVGSRQLADLPFRQVVEGADRVARRFLDPEDPLRTDAMKAIAGLAGYSGPMAEAVLDGMAGGWRSSELERLLQSEFEDPGVLDGFRWDPRGGKTRAVGYPVAFHLGAGTVPGVAVTSMIRSLLVKSAVLLRPSGGDLAFAVAFARVLAEEVPELASAMAVVHWPTDATSLTETVLSSVDLVVAYGSDETLGWIRNRIPLEVPFVPYRHRLGVGMVGREALKGRVDGSVGTAAGSRARETARSAARAVAFFDQRGCVSPHVFIVEEGGAVSPESWATLLTEALAELEQDLPSGEVSPGAGADIQQIRGAAEMAEGSGRGWVKHGGSAPWTVTILPDEPLTPSCSHRVVRVVPVTDAEGALKVVTPWAPFLQSVGLEGFGSRTSGLEEGLARLGASRIVPLSAMPWPPSWWHHDGGSPLRDLVRWTDIEEM